MAHSVALAIIIEEDENKLRELQKNIERPLFLMDVKLSTIPNGTSKSITEAVKKILKMDSSQILDILVIIYAPLVTNHEDRKFATKDAIMDIHEDIIRPLFTEDAFKEKCKIIITNGYCKGIPLYEKDSSYYQHAYAGDNCAIVLSEESDFVSTTLSFLASNGGDFSATEKDIKNIFTKKPPTVIRSTPQLNIRIPVMPPCTEFRVEMD